MRSRALAPLCVVLVAVLVACNGLVGIADFHEVGAFDDDADGSVALDAPPASAVADANTDSRVDPGVDSGADSAFDSSSFDAAVDVAPDSPPLCASPLVALQISVVASPTMAYSAVDVHAPVNLAQSIAAGESRTICASVGDLLDLRGRLDSTSALHQWNGTPCGTTSRCKFTMAVPVVATVHLE